MNCFVVAGGGAAGAFEVGVMKQLANQGIVPDIIFGTSTGALNAAGYSYIGIDKLIDVWTSIKGMDDIMKLHCPLILPFLFLFGKGPGAYSMKPLEKKINNIIQGVPKITTVACRVSLINSQKEYVYSAPAVPNIYNYRRAVLASTSTPVLNDIVDGEFIDGGVRQITPLEPAISCGADNIYAILAQPYGENINLGNNMGNIFDIINRTIACMIREMFWQDIQSFKEYKSTAKLTVYAPDVSIIQSDQFDPILIQKSIQQGLSAKPVLTIN